MCGYAYHRRGRGFGRRRHHRIGMLVGLIFAIVAIARAVIAVLAEARHELEEIAYYPRGYHPQSARPPGNSMIPRENDYPHAF